MTEDDYILLTALGRVAAANAGLNTAITLSLGRAGEKMREARILLFDAEEELREMVEERMEPGE